MASINIHRSETIHAEADELWRILGDEFATINQWASDIPHSKASIGTKPGLEGAPCAGRTCEIPGFGETDEHLVAFDPTTMNLAYTVTAKKLPSFVKNMRNEWTVNQQGEGHTQVSARITADATGIMGAMAAPMMRMKLRSTMKQVFDDLRVYAESGDVSAAKTKALAKAQK